LRAHHSSLRSAKQSSRGFAWPARSGPQLTAGFRGAAATRLRFQESSNVAKLVPDRSSVDSPERAAHVQSSFVLQHLHAAPADGSVDMLIDPRPRDGRHLREIDGPGSAAHVVTALLPQLAHPLWCPSVPVCPTSFPIFASGGGCKNALCTPVPMRRKSGTTGHSLIGKGLRLGHQLGHGVGHRSITGTPSCIATRERSSARPYAVPNPGR
jgi:hypothetical protein